VKRVLVIAFDFPPRRTSAVYRMTGLLKYLPGCGWEPTVLTVRARKGDTEDATLLGKLPANMQVVRTRYFNISGWEDMVLGGIRTVKARRPRSVKEVQKSRTSPFLRSLADFVRSYLYFPDQTWGWVPFALVKAVRLHFRRPFDLIYTTSPPRSSPVVGLLLRALLRVPWVAEFRDPWYPPKRAVRRKLERWLQLAMLQRADIVVVHAKGYGEELRDSWRVPADKLAVVSNGFDEEDFTPQVPSKTSFLPPDYLHLSHFGTVYPNFSGSFFPALAEFLQECPELKQRLRVNIIGFPDDIVLRYATSSELRDVIRVHGFIRHAEALEAMRSSHGLLLFLADPEVSRLSGLGKIYEYLRVGRPVLAVAPEGGTKELVLQAEAGWVVPPEDRDAIKSALMQWLQQNVNGVPPLPKRPDFVAQFRYDHLVHDLVRVFDRVANRHG
jgi:glycosyltransferase involved in cell wall biosynthesis